MTFKIGEKTFKTTDIEILKLIKEATKKKDTGAVIVMLAAGEAFGVIKEITT